MKYYSKENQLWTNYRLFFNEGDMQYYFEDIYVIPPYSINTYFILKLKNPLNTRLLQVHGDHRKKQISCG